MSKARWHVTWSGLASSTNSRERDVHFAMGIEDAQNHAVRPQFPGNHNIASPGLKLFQAVRKSPSPGRIITCSPAKILDRINSITPALGVTPPSSKLLHSSTRLPPPRSAAIAETTESTQPSIKICSLLFIQHRA
jgi:hypothetical protein